MSKWVSYNNPCPKCSSSDGVSYDKEGGGYCFSCRSFIRQSEETQQQRKPTRMGGHFWNIEDIDNFRYADLSHRGIESDVVKLYGVRQDTREENGEPGNNIFFPGGAGGYKRKNKLIKKDQENIGDYGLHLFGANLFPSGGKFVVVTEGEEDCLAAYQMIKNRGKGYPWSVVSLQNGAGDFNKKKVFDYLSSFEGVLLCFDMDEQGQEAVEKFASVYHAETKIKVAELPEKDANECLMKGKEREFLSACYNAKEYKPDVVVEGGDITLDLISEPVQRGYYWSKFPQLMDKLKGWRHGELTVVLAPSNVGKSTFVAELGYEFINSGEKTAYLFLEEDKKKCAQRLVALHNGVSLPKYRMNPSILSKEQREKTRHELFDSGRVFLIDTQFGAIPEDRLVSTLRWYHYAKGCTRFIFDHLSLVVAADPRENERKMIDNLLQKFAALVTETGITLIVVAHIKRWDKPVIVKDKINEDIRWLLVRKEDARGSGGFEQMSDQIITLEPQIVDEGERGLTRIRLDKQREWPYLGICDTYRQNFETGLLEPVDITPEY